MNKSILMSLLLIAILTSCNKEKIFPDFEYQTVYFAYQYPVRTVTFGEDIFNTDLDNQKKVKIFATTGGVYFAKNDVNVKIAVDNSLLGNGMTFGPGGADIIPMPTKYFSLASDNIIIPKGELSGGVEVQLTDDFFADPLAIRNSYVIPLRIISVTNADSILYNKDFMMYAVKYVNQWHGNYLRRGRDVFTGSVSQTISRRTQFIENNEVRKLNTRTLTDLEFPIILRDASNNNVNVTLLLKFDSNGKCTVSSGTTNITATGTGEFVKRGDKNSWGNKDRDALYLNYQITLPTFSVATTDTLVMRDRAVTMETFTPARK
jgi:hypothetical protein